MSEHVAVQQARRHLAAAYEKLRRKTRYPATNGSLDEFGAVTAAERYLSAYRRYSATQYRFTGDPWFRREGDGYYRDSSTPTTAPTTTPTPADANKGHTGD